MRCGVSSQYYKLNRGDDSLSEKGWNYSLDSKTVVSGWLEESKGQTLTLPGAWTRVSFKVADYWSVDGIFVIEVDILQSAAGGFYLQTSFEFDLDDPNDHSVEYWAGSAADIDSATHWYGLSTSLKKFTFLYHPRTDSFGNTYNFAVYVRERTDEDLITYFKEEVSSSYDPDYKYWVDFHEQKYIPIKYAQGREFFNLIKTVPRRAGMQFLGWSTSASTDRPRVVDYPPGARIYRDDPNFKNETTMYLYAVWREWTFKPIRTQQDFESEDDAPVLVRSDDGTILHDGGDGEVAE